VYVKKRKNLFERQRVVIGEPINPSELFGKMPSLTDMEKITELLREKERQLKEIADKD
jgi:hypothetical protein